MFKEEIHLDVEPELEQEDYEKERNKPMPDFIHGTIQLDLGAEFKAKYGDRFHFASEVTLDTSPASTPDICIFEKSNEALDWRTTPAKAKVVPLTTIEIISPSQSLNKLAEKIWEIYFKLGVKSAWLVMPPPFKAIYVFTPTDKLYFDSGTLTDPVTGIQIELDKVFQGLK